MSWIYPQAIVLNDTWYDYPSGYGVLPALAVGDDEYAWTPAGITTNILHLDMGQFCGLCEIRARRGTSILNDAQLLVNFFDDLYPNQSEQWIINLTNIPQWTTFTYTPSFPWRYITLEGQSIQVLVAVSVIRAEALAGALIPRRLLTGVGL